MEDPSSINTCTDIAMRYIKYIVILLILAYSATVPVTGYGQKNMYSIKTLSKQDGLSNNFVTWVYEDSRGFIWFATSDGLNRWDGYEFVVFRHNPGDENSLPNNFILCLNEDHNNNLWIGTNHYGLARYNLSEERFYRYPIIPQNETTIPGDLVRCIFTDNSGIVWVGTNYGLARYQTASDDFKRYRFPGDSEQEASDVRSIFYSQTDDLIIQTSSGLFKYDSVADMVVHANMELPDRYHEILRNEIPVILNTSNSFWMSGLNGIFKYDFKRGTDESYRYKPNDLTSISSPDISYVFEDSRNNIWIGTENNGLNFYNVASNNFTLFSKSGTDGRYLSNNIITFLYEDSHSNLWVATQEGGLNYLTEKNELIKYYTNNELNDKSIGNPKVSCFLEDRKGNLWIGTGNGGLNKSLEREGEFKRFNIESSGVSPSILSIVQKKDDDNLIFITGWGLGLYSFDIRKELFSDLTYDSVLSQGERYLNMKGMGMDTEGKLWLASHLGDGIIVYDPQKEKFYDSDNPDPYLSDLLNIPFAVSVYQDSKQRLWILTYTGLFMYDTVFNSYYSFPGDNTSLSSDYIFDLFEDSKQRLWVGSTHGLDLIVEKNGKIEFERYSSSYSLPGNIKGILEDSKGNLWLSSNEGIVLFNPESKLLKHYITEEEIPTLEYFERARIKSANGYMYFGSTDGFVSFHPDSLLANEPDSKIYLTDFQIFNQSQKAGEDKSPLLRSIIETKEIELNYDQSVLGFEYVGLNINRNRPLEYAYTMEGYDKDWYFVGDKRFATYSNLSPGYYTFRVKIADGNQLTDSEGISLDIRIKPPIWKTKLAYIIYVLIGIILLILFRWAIINRAKLLNELKIEKLAIKNVRETNLMKLRFFTNISHEFRTPLTLIKAPLEKLMDSGIELQAPERNYYYGLIQNNTNKLLKLINQLMDYRKLESGSLFLVPSRNDLIHQCKISWMQFQELAKKKDIDYTFQSDTESLYISFDEDKIDKIISNLLSNAFKFTHKGGKIDFLIKRTADQELQFKSNSESISLIIRDNGIGIKKEDLPHIFERFYIVSKKDKNSIEGTGIGLTLVKELTELHKGKITVHSSKGEGAEFIVKLPIIDLPEEELKDKATEEQKEPSSEPQLNHAIDQRIDGTLKTKSKKILVVEDDDELREFIIKELSDNYTCIEARDGEEGFRKAFLKMPNLVISDIMMPLTDGFKLCKSIKSDERTSHLPVILLTARHSQEKQIEGLELGADDYIYKPFNIDIFKKRINNMLTSRENLFTRFREGTDLLFKNEYTNEKDNDLIQSIIDLVLKNISEEKINADFISERIHISRSLVYIKIEAITGQTVNEFIRNIRLKKATRLLQDKSLTITEIAYAVGFSSQSYFTRSFTHLFGVAPKEYIKQNEHK